MGAVNYEVGSACVPRASLTGPCNSSPELNPAADPRGRDRASSPAPKAQPPRKRSGKRTARELALWKAATFHTSPTDGRNLR